ncbi:MULTISPECIES: helix-turn-helix domain-containing protein [Hyphobacterium]|uniref:Helix-turn-helix domain-containing protein n=1 Tax=Hyphobacterium vulgare TaxID=1736751 RepID=A0ABV6ZX84_9PROT
MPKRIEYEIRDSRCFPRSQHDVLLHIALRLGRNGTAWPSYATLAEDTRLSRRTVMRAVKALERSQVLNVERTSRGNVYSIDRDALELHKELTHRANAAARVRTQRRRPARNPSGRVLHCHSPVSGRSAAGDTATPKEKESKNKFNQGPNDLELLELLEQRDGTGAERAFERALGVLGFQSLLQHLTRHGRPLIRILIDPNRDDRTGASGLFIVCFDELLANHPDLPTALERMGFDEDAHWPMEAFRRRMSEPGLPEILPAPASRIEGKGHAR